MRYQFTMQPTRKASRGPALVFAALVSAVLAGYTFAACGDRSPDRASAGEPVVATPTPEPGPTAQPATTPDLFKLGRTAWREGKTVEAESAFVQALTLDSSDVKSRLYLSRVLIETGRAEQALPHIQQVIARDSTSSEPFRVEGRAFEVLGRNDEAIASYKHAIILNNDDVWALNSLGSVYMKAGRFEDAIGPIARAIELEKHVAIFHNNLGTALEKTGHYAAAAEAYRGALAVEGSYGPATTNLTRVEQLTQDPALPPVDLSVLIQKFRDEVATWKQ